MNNFELGRNANICIYEKLIPESLTKGYTLTNILLTTYGMEMQVLTKLLIALDGLAIVNDGVDVFYDVQSLQITEADYSVLPEKNMHGINLCEEGKKYAFHPKIIMLRYKRPESNNVRYVLVVLSKNITNAKNLDAFCVVYGDVQSETLKQHAGEVCVEGESNGQVLADWINKLYEKVYEEDAKKRGDFYSSELRKVIFRCEEPGVEEIRFLTESHMKKEIEGLKDIIIVSPFISGTLVDRENVRMVISRDEEYGKLSSESWKKIEKKAYQFAEELGEEDNTNSMVHAKIYCGKANKQTRLIIGSSNATVNGCAWNTPDNLTNMEFNVVLTLEDKVYKEFEHGLEEYIVCLKAREENKADIQQNEDRNIWGSLLLAIEELTVNKEENGWQFGLNLKPEFLSEHQNVTVRLSEEKGLRYQDSAHRLECKSNKVLECLWVNIKYGELENEYCLRLAPYIKNQCYQEVLKKRHLEDLNQVLKRKIDGMLRNSKNITLPPKGQSGKTTNILQRETKDKRYVYEKLKGLAINVKRTGNDGQENVSFEERYREQLVQLKKHTDLIREEQEYEDMSRAIGKLLNIEERGNE